MKLSSLLEKLEYTCVQGSTEQAVTGVVYDYRKVTDGSLFICIRAENNRNYRNQGKNHHYLYGKIHSGKCRIQGWSDRYY